MMAPTAAPTAVSDDDNNNNKCDVIVFADICAPHSKSCSCARNKLLHFMLIVLSATMLSNRCCVKATSTATGSAGTLGFPVTPREAHECGSMDIRNECESLLQLDGCTVVTGYVIIVLLPRINNEHNGTCNFEHYRFPLLREITDFLLFHDVRGLTSIRDMFPNLTVIRGRRLFLNYALGVTQMADLKALEFKSLVAITRGHVLVGTNPKLCHLEKINWDRLTLTTGENHIYPVTPEDCPARSECKGCESGYCWSNFVCQKFENDNVVNLLQSFHHCHEQCLGGCFNGSQSGCAVCRAWNDHGICVGRCPRDKYAAEHYLRCYTRDECVHDKKLYIHQNSCVEACPAGFQVNATSRECRPCPLSAADKCVKVCKPPYASAPIWVFNLGDVDNLQGCQILNGSVFITIRNKIDEQDLLRGFGAVQQITGYLKIYRSPHITSLRFLQSLRRISGQPLEYGLYSLILFNNKNLKELWPAATGFELERGGMFVHSNNKLCNRLLSEFGEKVVHDRTLDSLQTSDQEVLCSPAKMNLDLEVVSHESITFRWRQDQTSEEVEIIYRPIPNGTSFDEQSELDSDICTRINWRRRLLFPSELPSNGTHFSYTVNGLQQYTKYACLVKTFGRDDDEDDGGRRDARSDLKYVTTDMDIPAPPLISIAAKTESSLTVHLSHADGAERLVDYYVLTVYEAADDVDLLDRRDYCAEPALLYLNVPPDHYATASRYNEDYDDCCARLLEEAEDRVFRQKLRTEFGCSSERRQYCQTAASSSASDDSSAPPIHTKRLEHSETTYVVRHLERFRLYVVQVQACNHVGCGSYSQHAERTNFSAAADRLDDLSACHVANTHEFRVRFSEPKHPNSYITSYVVHFRLYLAGVELFQSHIKCLTRKEHSDANYVYVGHLNSSYNEVTVRVHSLAGDVFMEWINVSTCDGSAHEAGVGVVPSDHPPNGWNVFLVLVLVGFVASLLWLGYKRRCWRRIPEMRRYLPLQQSWRSLATPLHPALAEDRQILVEAFQRVRFRNTPLDDHSHI